jgi:hypothetical protein
MDTLPVTAAGHAALEDELQRQKRSLVETGLLWRADAMPAKRF